MKGESTVGVSCVEEAVAVVESAAGAVWATANRGTTARASADVIVSARNSARIRLAGIYSVVLGLTVLDFVGLDPWVVDHPICRVNRWTPGADWSISTLVILA